MKKAKRDNLELTERGRAIFREAEARIEKAYKEWKKFYEKYKESVDETN